MINEYLTTYLLNKRTLYKNVMYPEIETHDQDIYIISDDGDRLDNLSYEFYQTTNYWWMIAIANNLPKDTFYIEAGTSLRIPTDTETILNKFQELNQD